MSEGNLHPKKRMTLVNLFSSISWVYKIIILALVLLAFGASSGLVSVFNTYTQDKKLKELVEASQLRGNHAMEIGDAVVEVDARLQLLIAAQGRESRKASIATIQATSILDEKLHNLAAVLPDEERVKTLTKILTDIRPTQMQAIKAARKNKDDIALQKTSEILAQTTIAKKLANEIVADERNRFNHGLAKISKDNRKISNTIILMLIISTIVGLLVSIIIARQITRPLKSTVSLANKIGTGDLSSDISIVGSDEISELLTAIKQMQTGLLNQIEIERKANEEKERIEKEKVLAEKKALEEIQLMEAQQIEAERISAEENNKIKQSLDNVGQNVMMVDSDQKICYLNNLMKKTLETSTLADCLNLSVNQMKDKKLESICSIDGFSSSILSLLECNEPVTLHLNECVFVCRADPVINADGIQIGSVIEWREKTQEENSELEINKVISAVQDGDLSKKISVDDKSDFFLTVANGVNKLVDSLAQTIEEMQANLTDISLSCTTVADNNQLLSDRVKQQSSAVRAVTNEMERITTDVISSSENGKVALKAAYESKNLAIEGGDIVTSAIHAVNEISESSNKISDITDVVNDITFQTNLLALNASVEAARAGEHGRGFSVVAGEVRNLAQRSASAVKDINNLIEDTLEKVESGTGLVDNSGSALQQICSSAENVGNVIEDITAASENQRQSIQAIDHELKSIAKMNTQNEDLVSNTAQTSKDMQEKIKYIETLLNRFILSSFRSKKKDNHVSLLKSG